ncbi:hypothetical protein C7G42_14735 [Bradyrhizobium sp. MOS003]|nr:hypothetical protein C7G42_14735 [Bradyrhizobium sp. MOS003]
MRSVFPRGSVTAEAERGFPMKSLAFSGGLAMFGQIARASAQRERIAHQATCDILSGEGPIRMARS